MRRCICLMLQPRSANSTASQSSSSGWVGGSPWRPKSFGVRTIPSPKCPCQMRFTITRASSGLSGRGQPERERLAALRNEENIFRLDDGRPGVERGEEPGLHLLALVLEIAANQNVGVGDHLFVCEDIGGGIAFGRAQIRFAELLEQGGALRIHGGRTRRRGGGIGLGGIGLIGLNWLRASSAATASAAASASATRRHLFQDLGLAQAAGNCGMQSEHRTG